MASPVPAKSQPLHNFSLPELNWKKIHSDNLHRGRRVHLPSRIHRSPPRRHQSPSLRTIKQSPMRDSPSESKSGVQSNHGKASAHEGNEELIDNSEKETKSKIYIRLGNKSKVSESVHGENYQDSLPNKDEPSDQEKGVSIENSEIEEFVEPKTWNLRPRKPLHKPVNVNNGGSIKIHENKAQTRPDVNANTAEKKEKKQKFSISLTREEIDKDLSLMTGSRPSRKPKKRARTIQKQLDNLFPGLWLSSVTADCYKVPDPPIKG